MLGSFPASLLDMTVVLGHSSAWQYWLHTGVPNKESDAARLLPPPRYSDECDAIYRGYVPDLDVPTLQELSILGLPIDGLHISVGISGHRRRCHNMRCHQSPAAMPTGAVLKISEHVYISSPELVFFQKASENSYSLEKLIMLGYGVCGRFALSKGPAENDLVQISERASVDSLNGFLDSIEGLNKSSSRLPRGLERSRRAAKRIIGSVESPQEARIAMLEFLDAALGGNAVSAPECNGEVVLNPEIMKMTGRSSFRCDFIWRKERVVLEYNGSHHGEQREVRRDAEKYNALRMAGYEVILATGEHIYNKARTDDLAKQLRRVLGQRAPRTQYDHNARKNHLRKELGLQR